METFASFLEGVVRAIDMPLGWLLWLPRDLSVILFALGTAFLMTVARRVITNQDLLHRCRADLIRLKSLVRDARSSADKAHLGRLKTTIGQIKGIQLAADFRVLCVVIVPVAMLAIWASERFDYQPPRVGQNLTIRATFPISSVDRVTHLVPMTDLQVQSTAIQVVKSDGKSPPQGTAEWTIRPTAAGDMDLTIRHQQQTVIHRIRVGQTTYLPPTAHHQVSRLPETTVQLQRYLPLGFDWGSKWVNLPPWMMWYVLLTLILVPLMRRVLHVA